MPRTKLRRYFRHGLLPQMMVFESVARLGSVTRAARELHLAQPTVSTHLHKLAGTLEVALFEREGRRLKLTAAGRALRQTCLELEDLLVRGDARLSAWRHVPRPALQPALLDSTRPHANNRPGTDQEQGREEWNFRGSTTRQST
jgi:DNA-binding transcriptional LysR family regulator